MRPAVLFLAALVAAIATPANAFESYALFQVSNGVIVVTCDRRTGAMLGLKTLVDIPEGTEMGLIGACEIAT